MGQHMTAGQAEVAHTPEAALELYVRHQVDRALAATLVVLGALLVVLLNE